MQPTEFVAYIGLGANLGDPQECIKSAILELAALPSSQLTQSSSLYSSAPMDADGDDYVNAVVELRTKLSPKDLLSELQRLEQQFGRTRSYQNAPRTLDLDLLLYANLSLDTASLQIPHPRMHQRAFVILPLLEIAPLITIPGLGSAQTLLISLADQSIQKMNSV